MTSRCSLALLFLVAACRQEAPIGRHPIDTVNPVIGDLSFVRAFGRAPTPEDDPAVRVQHHLAYVEGRLRGTDVSALPPEQRIARAHVLDNLHRYWVADRFPASETAVGLLPTFIDGGGVRCAVAYLVEQDAGEAAIRAIDARYHNAYIAQIDAPALAVWAATSGLSRDELALIQPSYPPRPRGPNLELTLAAEYANSVAEDKAAGTLTHAGLVRGSLHRIADHNPVLGDLIVGFDGAAGWAAGGNAIYDAHLTLGTRVSFWLPGGGHQHRIGITGGFGVDAIGDRIPRAWTIPIDAFWYVPSSRTTRLGLVGGPRFAIADRRLGWRVGLDAVLRDYSTSESPLAVRDLHVGVGVERVADATFVNVSVGGEARSRFGWYSRD